MFKLLKISLYILSGSVPSLFIINFLKISTVKFIGSEFLLGYLGVFLGFAFSIVTFIITLTDKARSKIDSDISYTDYDKKITKKRIADFLEEVSDNMKFVFYSFIVVVFIMVLEVWDVPCFSLKADLWYTKNNLLSAIKFSIFGWSVYAIYDLLVSTFSLNEKVEAMLRRQ